MFVHNAYTVENEEMLETAIDSMYPVILISDNYVQELEKKLRLENSVAFKMGTFLGEYSLATVVLGALAIVSLPISVGAGFLYVATSLGKKITGHDKDSIMNYHCFIYEENNITKIILINRKVYNKNENIINGFEDITFTMKKKCPICSGKLISSKDGMRIYYHTCNNKRYVRCIF